MTPLVLYALAFAGLAALAGALLAAGRAPFALRLALAAATPWLAFAVWQAARPPAGWPASAQPPQDAAFVSGVARVPSAGDPGEIDLWVEPAGATRPRAYRLPYSPALHQQLLAALAAQRRTRGNVRLLVRQPARSGGGRGRLRSGMRGTLTFVSARLPAKKG